MYNIPNMRRIMFMLKREPAIRKLILNGYNEALAIQLPKLFITDFLDKEEEKLSETLDIFIDNVQRGYIFPNENGNVIFGSIQEMSGTADEIFHNFKFHIEEEFHQIVKRRPLQDILLKGGALKLHPELAFASEDTAYYEKEIVGDPEAYNDLCVIHPTFGASTASIYINIKDLYSLLLSKGFSEESISIIFGIYGMGTKYPKHMPIDGIYLNYDEIINLGTSNLKDTSRNLKKDIRKNDRK